MSIRPQHTDNDDSDSKKQMRMILVAAAVIIAVALAIWSGMRFMNTQPRVTGTLGDAPAPRGGAADPAAMGGGAAGVPPADAVPRRGE